MVKLKHELKIIKKEDSAFPWRLKVLADCPDIIYALGNIDILNDFSIAVVGSRICDEYGEEVTKRIVKGLVQRDICIVSGLAKGIDTIAHKTAIDNGGKTIAIIGGGFEKIFPSSNQMLADEIINKGGAIISEYFPDQPALSFCFPKRNRLVACITEGTLVTQAKYKSGALITANIAKKLSKKVYAVPGNIINLKCEGSNSIINFGAKLVQNANDILEDYMDCRLHVVREKQPVSDVKKLPDQYAESFFALSIEPQHINEIHKKTGRSIQALLSDFTMLEMQGFIERLPGDLFKLL